MTKVHFEWDEAKEVANEQKHGVSFAFARKAFLDTRRVIARDEEHSGVKPRFYCFGKAGAGVLTVRFTWRNTAIRIIGAGYWRKGKHIYERENSLHP